MEHCEEMRFIETLFLHGFGPKLEIIPACPYKQLTNDIGNLSDKRLVLGSR